MRLVSVVLVLWLIVGAAAAGQRHYFNNADPNCSRVGNIAITILAGPLNYLGVNPKVDCHVPHPSK